MRSSVQNDVTVAQAAPVRADGQTHYDRDTRTASERTLDHGFTRLPATSIQLGSQRTTQSLTGARESRHHGSDGDTKCVCQFLVRQSFQLAKHDQLTKSCWQMPYCIFDQRHIVLVQQQHLGRPVMGGMYLFVKGVSRALLLLAVGVVTNVSNNTEEPAASVVPRERSKVTERSQRRLLHDVFSIVFTVCQGSRKTIGLIEMW